jgi:hypothetical protein
MNDASYGALVGLRPKGSGRVFKTRYIPSGTRLRPGPSCEESR